MTPVRRLAKRHRKSVRLPGAQSPLSELVLGEDSTRQFKRDVTNGDALAAEMAAFANSEGGTIFLGVDDDGTTTGLSAPDLKRLNQLIGITANHSVKSPLTVSTKNVPLKNGRVVIRRACTLRTRFRSAFEVGTRTCTRSAGCVGAAQKGYRSPTREERDRVHYSRELRQPTTKVPTALKGPLTPQQSSFSWAR